MVFLVCTAETVLSGSIFVFSIKTMLQDTQTIRYYQRLTDSLVDLWNRGYRFDDLRLYIDGYLAALRQSNSLEPYLIHRLEEEITRYLYDSSNMPNQMPEPDYR
jgi:hypothetical protein